MKLAVFEPKKTKKTCYSLLLCSPASCWFILRGFLKTVHNISSFRNMDKPKKEKKEKKNKHAEIEVEEIEEPMKLKKSKKEKRNRDHNEIVVEDVVVEEVSEKPKKEKKNKHREVVVEEPEEVVKEKKSKKHKRSEEVEETPVKKVKTVVEEEESNEWDVPVTTPKYWQRIDETKYIQAVQGTKFADNSHYVKGGDAWGNDAADRLGKVKGRGFKKEMSKLKRASWKGCGSIDTGVNSVQFSDWED